MKPRVVKDDRKNLDKLLKQLEGLDRSYVVAGLVGAAQSTGKPAGDEVIGYGSVQEFGAVIKGHTRNVTMIRSRRTHKLVKHSKAMTSKASWAYYANDYTVNFKGHVIPSRPWLRSWYDTSLTRLIKFAEVEILRSIMNGQPAEVTLNRIGVFAQAGIRKRIRTARTWAKPLAPSTIRKKGSSAPLIDKGVMINSVSFDIRKR